jgi:hypothetical protein
MEKGKNGQKEQRETEEYLTFGYEVRPAVVSFSRARKKIVCGNPKQRAAS